MVTITLKDGRVRAGQLPQFASLRLREMPAIEVYIVPSRGIPGGVGDAGTAPIAPAVANAIFEATGQRLRRLPIAEQLRT